MVLALLERVADHGPSSLPDNRNHAVNDNPKILQFTAGNNVARLLYFFDEGRCVIICEAFIKPGGKSQHTPKAPKKTAVNVYRRYFAAKENNELEWVE